MDQKETLFPLITHINDVKPFIEGRDEFKVFEKDWYDVVNYPGKVIPPDLLREMHSDYELPSNADRNSFNYVIRGGNWNHD